MLACKAVGISEVTGQFEVGRAGRTNHCPAHYKCAALCCLEQRRTRTQSAGKCNRAPARFHSAGLLWPFGNRSAYDSGASLALLDGP